MYAGDSLEQVVNFEKTDVTVENIDGHIRDKEEVILLALFRRFISDRPENVHHFVVLGDSGFVTVFESSYQLKMPDSSYLHILAFGSYDNIGSLLHFGISVNEHLDNQTYNGGYLYNYSAQEGFTRTTSPLDDEADEGKNDDYRKEHFMISDLYAFSSELEAAQTSDDFEEREHAHSVTEVIKDEREFDRLLVDAGLDGLRPTIEELDKLKALIWEAEPFPVHK